MPRHLAEVVHLRELMRRTDDFRCRQGPLRRAPIASSYLVPALQVRSNDLSESGDRASVDGRVR